MHGTKNEGLIALLENTLHADCIVLLEIKPSFVYSSAITYSSFRNSTSMCVASICAMME